MKERIPTNASIRTTLRLSRQISLQREVVQPPRHSVPNTHQDDVRDAKIAQHEQEDAQIQHVEHAMALI